MPRPLLAIGGIALIGFGVLFGFGFWWTSTATADAEVGAPIRSVRIDNDSGSVRIRTGDVTTSTVHQKFDYHWRGQPGDAFSVDGDKLVLPGCGWNCTVDYEVVVPRGTAIEGKASSGDITLDGVASADVHADSGTIRIRDVSGTVKADASSGDVDLSGVAQDVTVRADSGAIRGDRLRGKVDARAESGTIALTLDVAQDVKARADSGGIRLNVPPGPYRITGDTDSGDRSIDVPNDSGAPHLLDLSTDSGDVTVKAA